MSSSALDCLSTEKKAAWNAARYDSALTLSMSPILVGAKEKERCWKLEDLCGKVEMRLNFRGEEQLCRSQQSQG